MRSSGRSPTRSSLRKGVTLLALTLLLVVLLISTVAAEGEMISRFLVSSGGGRIANDDVALQSVIGQPAARPVSNGTVSLCAGFQCTPGVGPAAETATITPTPTQTATSIPATQTPTATAMSTSTPLTVTQTATPVTLTPGPTATLTPTVTGPEHTLHLPQVDKQP